MANERKVAMFFDVDGTLVTDLYDTIPESCLKALQMAKDNGHYIFLNTGRTLCSISDKLHNIGFDGLLCGCGTYITFRDQIIRKSSIPKERGHEIMRGLVDANMGILLEGTEDLYFQRELSGYEDIDSIRFRRKDWGLGQKSFVEDYDYEYDKFLVCINPESDVDKLYELVGDEMEVIDRHGGTLEIIQKGFTKGTAIEDIRQHLGLSMDDIYVFGDSSNDITMFEYADHAIAMGDHDPLLDPLTEYVTDTMENDGIYNAMKHYGFI